MNDIDRPWLDQSDLNPAPPPPWPPSLSKKEPPPEASALAQLAMIFLLLACQYPNLFLELVLFMFGWISLQFTQLWDRLGIRIFSTGPRRGVDDSGQVYQRAGIPADGGGGPANRASQQHMHGMNAGAPPGRRAPGRIILHSRLSRFQRQLDEIVTHSQQTGSSPFANTSPSNMNAASHGSANRTAVPSML